MSDDEAKERAGVARLMNALWGEEEMRRRAAEDREIVQRFRARARDLHGADRQAALNDFIREVIEVRAQRSEDPDRVRAEYEELMDTPELQASFAKLLVPPVEG